MALYYFTGKVRAFWNDKIFFFDQHNVAVVSINNVFNYGNRATMADLEELNRIVECSDWGDGPELHSYVTYYPRDEIPPWPYKLKGKVLWMAMYAWAGPMPEYISRPLSNYEVIYMPVSYYTGKVIQFFDDKVLFGDYRNNVMVNLENLYLYGERLNACNRDRKFNATNPNQSIHSFITRLSLLNSKYYMGPEPHFPTWPKDVYGPDTWIALFAWQGEMPNEVRMQMGRFHVIRMNEWGTLNSFIGASNYHHDQRYLQGPGNMRMQGPGNMKMHGPGNMKIHGQGNMQNAHDMHPHMPDRESIGPHEMGPSRNEFQARSYVRVVEKKAERANDIQEMVIVPTLQGQGLMKGTILMADDDQGLMTSFIDVISFTRDEFYFNGEKCADDASLSSYFQNRRLPLSAYVVPLLDPEVAFHVNVVWRAVCVWCGSPPHEFSVLKTAYERGMWKGKKLIQSPSKSKALSHFTGKIINLSHSSGTIKTKIGKDIIAITFKRANLYLYGSKFNPSCSLLDSKSVIDSYTWSLLAYPKQTESADGCISYVAVAVWQFHYQNSIMKDLQETITSALEVQSPESNENDNHTAAATAAVANNVGQHMSGWIVKDAKAYAIVQCKKAQAEGTYVYFKKSDLYVDGEQIAEAALLSGADKKRQCNMYAKSVPARKVDGLDIGMEASMAWIGKKPQAQQNSDVDNSAPDPDVIRAADVFVPFYKESKNKMIKHMRDQWSDSKDSAEESSQSSVNKSFESQSKFVKADQFGREDKSPVLEGMMTGHLLMADNTQGIITCFENIAGFTIDNFYIKGEKFNKNGSLSDFFNGKRIALRALVVPLKEHKLMFNCLVTSEAIRVWVGDEPYDLKNLNLELQSYQRRLASGHKDSTKCLPSGKGFKYFFGTVTEMSPSWCIIISNASGAAVRVAFDNKSLFIHGNKVPPECNLLNFNSVLKSSTWSVLAYSVPAQDILGVTIEYKAFAVWHYNNQYQVAGQLLSIARMKAKELCFDKDVYDNEVAPGPVIYDPRSPTDRYINGWIMTVKGGFGIVRCGNARLHLYVIFKSSTLWLDGLQWDGSMKSLNQRNPCSLLAYSIPRRNVDGVEVTLEASTVWVGRRPQHLLIKPSVPKSKVIHRNDEYDREMQDEIVDVAVNGYQGSALGKTKSQLSPEQETDDKHVGKHLSAVIVDVVKDIGIAQWHSSKFGGNVYIQFCLSDVYIDHNPMDSVLYSEDLSTRSCNFYVLPLQEKRYVGDYTVSLQGTCGWVGGKPAHIPRAGTQQLSKIDLGDLHVTPEGSDDTDEEESTIEEISPVCFELEHSFENLKLPPDTHTSPIIQPVPLPVPAPLPNWFTRSPSPVKISSDIHVSPLPISPSHSEFGREVAEEGTNGTPNISMESEVPWKSQEVEPGHMKGKIIELHLNMGRLQGEDGRQHFFSRDSCYLYGVSLKSVELWHVLVQGQDIVYKLSEMASGTVKVEYVWVGAQKIHGIEKTAQYIYEWCKSNHVPDDARDKLLRFAI